MIRQYNQPYTSHSSGFIGGHFANIWSEPYIEYRLGKMMRATKVGSQDIFIYQSCQIEGQTVKILKAETF